VHFSAELLGLALLGVWSHRFWLIAAATGLFRVVGLDWALYAAQALVFRSAEPQGIYSIDRVEAALSHFARTPRARPSRWAWGRFRTRPFSPCS